MLKPLIKNGIGAIAKRCAYTLLFLQAIFLAGAVCAQTQSGAGEPMRLTPHPVYLTIEAGSNPIRYAVEIADDASERQRGLMFRTDLPDDQGMLFVFDQTRLVTMWMENTPTSLDMLFISEEGRIVTIARDTTPFSRATISSDVPVRYVLELNAGQAARHNIAIGQFVRHPAIRLDDN